mmetsp:Transcript_11242/g.31890  ORF Transcript_11242/g.31890 Transcript_11242/m.31890 type:complete len:214 (-) Transcript_11242:553-1194(-)
MVISVVPLSKPVRPPFIVHLTAVCDYVHRLGQLSPPAWKPPANEGAVVDLHCSNPSANALLPTKDSVDLVNQLVGYFRDREYVVLPCLGKEPAPLPLQVWDVMPQKHDHPGVQDVDEQGHQEDGPHDIARGEVVNARRGAEDDGKEDEEHKDPVSKPQPVVNLGLDKQEHDHDERHNKQDLEEDVQGVEGRVGLLVHEGQCEGHEQHGAGLVC